MKLFKIELDNVGYDDYDSCNFVKYEEWEMRPIALYDYKNLLSESFDIHNGQKWTITEVDVNEIKQPTIICSSFNAG